MNSIGYDQPNFPFPPLQLKIFVQLPGIDLVYVKQLLWAEMQQLARTTAGAKWINLGCFHCQ